jgi:hypothetical protein
LEERERNEGAERDREDQDRQPGARHEEERDELQEPQGGNVGKLYDEDYLRAHIYNDVENLERWVSDNKNFLGTRLLIRFELV